MKKILSLILTLIIPLILFSQDYEEIKVSELPKGVESYVKKKMPGTEIIRAARGTESGQTIYATVLLYQGQKRIMIFDKEGNFLRKAENISSQTTAPPPVSDSSTPKSGSAPSSKPETASQQTIPEKSLPVATQNYLKNHHTNYTLLDIKYVPFAESPIFKVVLRDATSDNVYIFNVSGEMTNKRSYTHASSPFVKQYPLQ